MAEDGAQLIFLLMCLVLAVCIASRERRWASWWKHKEVEIARERAARAPEPPPSVGGGPSGPWGPRD